MGTVSGPELIWPLCLTVVLLARLETNNLSRLDQPLSLQDTKDSALRDVPTFGIDELQGKLPGGQFW